MWDPILFAASIIAVVNIFLWMADQTGRKGMKTSIPDTIDVGLLKSAKKPVEADPRNNKKVREYLSIGLLKGKLSKDGIAAVEISERGKKILSGRE